MNTRGSTGVPKGVPCSNKNLVTTSIPPIFCVKTIFTPDKIAYLGCELEPQCEFNKFSFTLVSSSIQF